MTDFGEWHGPRPWGSSGPWGGQAVSGTEWRRRPGLGGAGPGVLRAGVELGPRCSFSRPLAQQKCDSTTSDREITPVSCCSQQAFGARSHPHRSSDMFMGGGPDVPGYRSTCPAQIPATPRPSLQQAGHRSPSASGTGTLAEEAAVVSKRVPGGCRGARQPRPLLEKLRCSPGPSLPRPPLPVADTPHLDPRPSVASQRPGDPSWPRRRRRRDSPWFSCFLLLPSLLSSLLRLHDPPMRKNKNEQTEHPEH